MQSADYTQHTHFFLSQFLQFSGLQFCNELLRHYSPVSNIESDNSQNVGLEDYNNISYGIFPHFTTPSIKISLG